MNHRDLMALLPLLITGYAAVALMLVAAFRPKHAVALVLTLAGLAAALVSVSVALPYAPRMVTTLIRVDGYSIYFMGLVLAATILVSLLSASYLHAHERRSSAFYILLLLAALGMETLTCSVHFASFFLGIEILSVSLYGLIGYTRDHRPSLEGAIKYLVLAAAASAFLLLGIALVYADSGTMDFRRLAANGLPAVSFLGLALIVVAFGFKLAIVPFHMWSPDVYQGAPAPVTALIATGSKGAVFALLLRLVYMWHVEAGPTFVLMISILAIATMLAGNLLALLQTNVKRLLAYSSIAHIGYLLIPLLAGAPLGPASIAFYLASYFAATIAAFGVIAVLSSHRRMGDVEELDEYRGLAGRHPVLALIFTAALLSLTGIPPAAGFIAKFYIFSAAIRADLWALVIVGVVSSGISAFYYLRVIIAMYSAPESDREALPGPSFTAAIALGASVAALLALGVYPSPLVHLVEQVVSHLSP